MVQFLPLIFVRADSSGCYFFRLKYTYLPFVYRILTILLADLKQKFNCTYIFLRLFNSTPLLLFAKGLQFCLLPFKFSLAIRHIFIRSCFKIQDFWSTCDTEHFVIKQHTLLKNYNISVNEMAINPKQQSRHSLMQMAPPTPLRILTTSLFQKQWFICLKSIPTLATILTTPVAYSSQEPM